MLLLGGASGVGKTSVSYWLAHHLGVGITEVDDFQIVLETLTTPEQQPVLHYWQTHPEAGGLPAEKLVEQTVSVGRLLAPAVRAVVLNHLETHAPLVLEGDFLLPETALHPDFSTPANAGRVRAVFLHEADKAQFGANFLAREPDTGPQNKRAQVSYLYSAWLEREAERCGVPVLPARPWDTLWKRLFELLKA